MPTLVLSAADVTHCLNPQNTLEQVEYVFREWGLGNIVMPAKVNLDMSRSGSDSWSNAMPAFLVSRKVAGIKWVGGYAENQKRGLPYIRGLIILTDPGSGETLAVMDGTEITNLRTGASAAIALKYLAKTDLRSIAIVGAGAQGKSCTLCLAHQFPKATVRICDQSPEQRRAFREEMSRQAKMEIVEAETVQRAVEGADAVILVTTAKTPFVKNEWISSGATVLGMGSYPQIEDAFAITAERRIVDSWDQAAHRGEISKLVEDGKLSRREIHAELGEIVAGRKPGRSKPADRILAVLVGLGAHDICTAQFVYEKARAAGLGQKVEI